MAGDVIGSAVIEVTADASGVSAGIAQATQAVKGFEQAATGSGAKAGAALSKANRETSITSSQLTREQERLISTINNYSNTVGKTRGEVLEFRASQAGITSQVQAQIAAIKSQEAALRSGGAALKTYGVSAGQTAAAFRQLPAQLTDVVTQLAGGQSPFLILLQQGGQVKDSFGGIGAAARALASLITPTTVAVAGLAAGFGALVVGVAHAESMARSLNTLQAQLTATGRANEFSNSELKAFISTLALAPGITRETATAVVAELSKVHQIGGELFRNLAKTAVDYAKATGTDVPTAARTLAQAFADPEKGAKALDAALGTLTSTQLLQIETMSQQNDRVGAQRVLFEALESAVKGLANNAMTPLQSATNDLGNAWEKAMQQIDKTQSFQNATSAATILLGRLTQIVNYLPEFEKSWSSAFSGGLNGMVMRAFGIAGNTPKAGGPQTGGASGSWEPAAGANEPKAASEGADDKAIKRALELGKAYQGQADKIADLNRTRKTLSDAMAKSITLYGKESEQAEKLKGQIAGVDEAIKSAQKKLAGPAGTGRQDANAKLKLDLDRIQKEQQAIVDANSNTERLLSAQRAAGLIDQKDYYAQRMELLKSSDAAQEASLEQQIVRLQKESYAGKHATQDQLDNQRKLVDLQAQLTKIRADNATSEKVLAIQATQAINAQTAALVAARNAAQDYLDTTNRGYARSLAGLGKGDKARAFDDQISGIEDRYAQQRQQIQNQRAQAQALAGGSLTPQVQKQFDEQLAIVDEFQSRALEAYRKYYAAWDAGQKNWMTGATDALQDYIDSVDAAAKRSKELVSSSLSGITDGITGLLTGDKGSSFKDVGKRIAEQITRGIVEQQITKPIAEWLQGSLKDGDSLIGKFLGGLTSNKGTGESWLGILGLGGGSKSGSGTAAGLASVSTSSNTASTSLISLAEAANQASFSLGGAGGFGGGGGGAGLFDSLISGIAGSIGGFSNGAATSLANATGTGLDGLFRYTNNFAGRAFGGAANAGSMYEVAENAPELLTVGNKTLLMMGKESGTVTPLRSAGGRGDTYETHVHVQGRPERETVNQIANRVSMEQRRARRLT